MRRVLIVRGDQAGGKASTAQSKNVDLKYSKNPIPGVPESRNDDEDYTFTPIDLGKK